MPQFKEKPYSILISFFWYCVVSIIFHIIDHKYFTFVNFIFYCKPSIYSWWNVPRNVNCWCLVVAPMGPDRNYTILDTHYFHLRYWIMMLCDFWQKAHTIGLIPNITIHINNLNVKLAIGLIFLNIHSKLFNQRSHGLYIKNCYFSFEHTSTNHSIDLILDPPKRPK